MASTKRTQTPMNLSRLFFAASIALAAGGSLFLTGDGLLRAQFGVAFEDHDTSNMVSRSDATNAVQPVAAGEDYWLGDASDTRATLASWGTDNQVRIGDRITLTTAGVKRALEVVSVRTIPPGTLAPGSNDNPVMVTLRPVEDTGGRVMHLLIDGNDELAPLASLFERAHEL